MKGLLLVVFVNFVGIGALIPVLPYAVIDVAGGSETLMAFLMASFSLAMFIGSPVLGALSDRLGRKRVLIGSIFVAAVAHAVFAFSTDLMMMFVARIVAGFAAGNLSVIMAIITDTTSQEERARWMGMLGAFVGLGFVAGPALGGLLSGVGGEVHTAPFMLAAVLALTGGIISQRTVEESAGPCQAETPDDMLSLAVALDEIARRLDLPLIFKASFDKANRTSADAPRGMGLEATLRAFDTIRSRTGRPVLTDVHLPEHCAPVAEVVDVLQPFCMYCG